MSNLLMKGVPEEKLNMGFAAYGRTYRAGSEPAPTGGRTPGPFTKIHGILSYYEVKMATMNVTPSLCLLADTSTAFVFPRFAVSLTRPQSGGLRIRRFLISPD